MIAGKEVLGTVRISIVYLASALASLLIPIACGNLTDNALDSGSLGILAFWLFFPMLAPFGLSYISHDFWMAGPTCVCDIIYHAGFISSGNLMTLVFLFLVMF